MSAEEERDFLAPWAQLAGAGNMLVVSPLRTALAQKIGKSQRIGGASTSGTPWLTQGGSRHATPQKRNASAARLEKKLPESLAALATPENMKGRRIRLMFQDEARSGRMVRIRKCWACAPQRPVVNNGYEREFVYVYGAVSPPQGELDWMICREMNALRMNQFLAQVSASHHSEFIVMVVDGVSSHVSKELIVTENVRAAALAALRLGTQYVAPIRGNSAQ